MSAKKFSSEKELKREIDKRKTYLARCNFGATVCAVVLLASTAAIFCALYFDTSLSGDQKAGLLVPGILLGLISLIAGICLFVCRYTEQDEIRELNHQLDDLLETNVQNWTN